MSAVIPNTAPLYLRRPEPTIRICQPPFGLPRHGFETPLEEPPPLHRFPLNALGNARLFSLPFNLIVMVAHDGLNLLPSAGKKVREDILRQTPFYDCVDQFKIAVAFLLCEICFYLIIR